MIIAKTITMKHTITLLLVVLWGFPTSLYAQTDSVQLDFERFMTIVRTQHPMSKTADLQVDIADANLMKAKGELDPKLDFDFNQKYFEGLQYYSLLNGELKVPTIVGIDLSGGYDQNAGIYLNPENLNPSAGLVYAGVSVPIGQGLLMDERRFIIREARALQGIASAERQMRLNMLYYEAGQAYWDWYGAYMVQQIMTEAVQVAEQRLEGVKLSIQFGDRPPIDSLEAGIQVQNRRLKLQEAQLKYQNTTAKLAVYLWLDGKVPVGIQDGTVPILKVELQPERILQALDTTNHMAQLDQHPVLLNYDAKMQQGEAKLSWQREQLKPTVDLKYNPITEPVGGDLTSNYSINNYTWGVAFNMPIFLRKERGGVRMADLKLDQLEYERTLKQQSLTQSYMMALNRFNFTNDQYSLSWKNRLDYKMLFEGEQQLFQGGESSLFMVNSRETAYINAQIELIKTQVLHRKALLEVRYAVGVVE